jgi:CheY-like chemotaxis protein
MIKILLIEDDRDVRETLVGILRAIGYEVETATDGVRALTMLRTAVSEGRDRPNVILLDLMMPNMDGYRFRSLVRDDADLGGIPIIVTTADRRVDEASLQAVCIKKPFDPDELIRAIKRLAP